MFLQALKKEELMLRDQPFVVYEIGAALWVEYCVGEATAESEASLTNREKSLRNGEYTRAVVACSLAPGLPSSVEELMAQLKFMPLEVLEPLFSAADRVNGLTAAVEAAAGKVAPDANSPAS